MSLATSPTQSWLQDPQIDPNSFHSRNRTKRTTKAAHKFVLLPEKQAEEENEKRAREISLFSDQEDEVEPTPVKMCRVTAYVAAEAYDLVGITEYFQKHFDINGKRIDECLHFSINGEQSISTFLNCLYKTDPRVSDSTLPVQIEDDDSIRSPGYAQMVNYVEPQYKFTVTLHNSLLNYCDIFFFDYGVIIFWNLPENIERILISLTKPSQEKPLSPKDWRIEDFLLHFHRRKKEGIYNDVIRLQSNRAIDKLTLSHAIGQSTKLLLLEDRMDATIEQIEHVPKHLAKNGTVGMNEENLRALIGINLKLKMDINLLTCVTDIPEIFRSMPAQTPLYQAARNYLEITQRTTILNNRGRVLSEVLEMLYDHNLNSQGHYLMWIIVVMVFIGVVVTVMENTLKTFVFEESGSNLH